MIEKIEKLRIEAKKKQLAIMEADADEKEEAKEEVNLWKRGKG